MFRKIRHSVSPITSAVLVALVVLLAFTPTASACFLFCWGCNNPGCATLPVGTACPPGGFFCPGWACTCGKGMYGVMTCLDVSDL